MVDEGAKIAYASFTQFDAAMGKEPESKEKMLTWAANMVPFEDGQAKAVSEMLDCVLRQNMPLMRVTAAMDPRRQASMTFTLAFDFAKGVANITGLSFVPAQEKVTEATVPIPTR